MKKVFCGVSGTENAGKTHFLSEVNARNELTTALVSYYHADFSLRPAQEEALINQKLTERSENAIISTPTNSGKSVFSSCS